MQNGDGAARVCLEERATTKGAVGAAALRRNSIKIAVRRLHETYRRTPLRRREAVDGRQPSQRACLEKRGGRDTVKVAVARLHDLTGVATVALASELILGF